MNIEEGRLTIDEFFDELEGKQLKVNQRQGDGCEMLATHNLQ